MLEAGYFVDSISQPAGDVFGFKTITSIISRRRKTNLNSGTATLSRDAFTESDAALSLTPSCRACVIYKVQQFPGSKFPRGLTPNRSPSEDSGDVDRRAFLGWLREDFGLAVRKNRLMDVSSASHPLRSGMTYQRTFALEHRHGHADHIAFLFLKERLPCAAFDTVSCGVLLSKCFMSLDTVRRNSLSMSGEVGITATRAGRPGSFFQDSCRSWRQHKNCRAETRQNTLAFQRSNPYLGRPWCALDVAIRDGHRKGIKEQARRHV